MSGTLKRVARTGENIRNLKRVARTGESIRSLKRVARMGENIRSPGGKNSWQSMNIFNVSSAKKCAALVCSPKQRSIMP